MKFPRTINRYCPKCRAHTTHNVSLYKKGKESMLAQGKRRFEKGLRKPLSVSDDHADSQHAQIMEDTQTADVFQQGTKFLPVVKTITEPQFNQQDRKKNQGYFVIERIEMIQHHIGAKHLSGFCQGPSQIPKDIDEGWKRAQHEPDSVENDDADQGDKHFACFQE